MTTCPSTPTRSMSSDCPATDLRSAHRCARWMIPPTCPPTHRNPVPPPPARPHATCGRVVSVTGASRRSPMDTTPDRLTFDAQEMPHATRTLRAGDTLDDTTAHLIRRHVDVIL